MNELKISTADRVFNILEDEILSSNKYKRGEYLTELKLCEELQVSRTPIREALNRIMQEGLIKETSKGMVVVGVSKEDIIEIYEVRARIEGYASSLCAKNITDEEIKNLEDTLDLQEFFTFKKSSSGISDTDSRFHSMIYEYCGNKTLQNILETLHRKVLKFRKLSVENFDRSEKAMVEHREILNAIKGHNMELAEKLSIEHINNAKENILKSL